MTSSNFVQLDFQKRLIIHKTTGDFVLTFNNTSSFGITIRLFNDSFTKLLLLCSSCVLLGGLYFAARNFPSIFSLLETSLMLFLCNDESLCYVCASFDMSLGFKLTGNS